MKLNAIIQLMEQLAPPVLQESYDNCGLQCGDPAAEVKGILLALDCTEGVIKEAQRKKCNLVIVHHPVIFKPLKGLTGRNEVERIIVLAVKKDIAIYACHTSLDNVLHGVNGKIAEKLGLRKVKVLAPRRGELRKLVTFCPQARVSEVLNALFKAGAGHIGNYSECSFSVMGTGSFRGNELTNPFVGKKGQRHLEKEKRIEVVLPQWKEAEVVQELLHVHPYEEVAFDIFPLLNALPQTGAGLIGELPVAMPEEKLFYWIRAIFGTGIIRHSPFLDRPIKKVALCGGSGAFLIPDAVRAGADVFITGDLKYHDFFLAEGRLVLADVGHAESEQFTTELFYEAIRKKFPKFAIHFSKIQTNPVNYF
ncbi:MAG: Nif3-like dinuclear metal center hexameric protein [Bacteroidia bacterium]|nr:Nif3-like dinuclear metal center hexameric protein [Bacteroidia bacterium]